MAIPEKPDSRNPAPLPEAKNEFTHGELVGKITTALRELGPMMCAEIARHLGLERKRVSCALVRMTTTRRHVGRRAHISDWSHEFEALRSYPRAIYDLGDQPDAVQPPLKTVAQIGRDLRTKQRNKLTMNFVFNLRAPRQKQHKSQVRA